VVTPGLYQCLFVFCDQSLDRPQFVLRKTMIAGDTHRLQTELGYLPVALHVNMNWLAPV
jgi:hypothetical protein